MPMKIAPTGIQSGGLTTVPERNSEPTTSATKPAGPLPPTRKRLAAARTKHGHTGKSELAEAMGATQQIFQGLHGGISGRKKNLDAVFEALDSRSADQIEVLSGGYQQHYGKSLAEDVLQGSGKKRAKEAEARLNGETSTGDAHRLRLLMPAVGRGRRSDELEAFLDSKSAPELRAMASEYTRIFGPIGRAIKFRLQGTTKKRALQLLVQPEGAQEHEVKARADAVALKYALRGIKPNTDLIFQVLAQEMTEERRTAMVQYFNDHSKKPLVERMEKKLSALDRQYAGALLQGDTATAAACLMQKQLNRKIVRPSLLIAILEEGVPPQQLRSAFAASFGDLDAAVSKRLKGRHAERAKLMLQDSGISQADELYFAASRLRPDADRIRELLDGLSREELDQVRADFQESRREPLDEFLLSKLRGRSKFDVGLLLEGAPQDAEEFVGQMRQRVAFEDNGLGSKAIMLIHRRTVGTAALDRLRRDLQEAERLLDVADDPHRMEELRNLLEGDLEANRQAVRALSDTAGNMAVLAAGTAVTLASGGLAMPATLAVVTATGAVSKVGTKALLEGAGYETWKSDALRGAAVAATMPLAELLQPIPSLLPGLPGAALRGTMLGGSIGGLSRSIETAVQPDNWMDGTQAGIRNMNVAFVRGAVLGAISGATISTALKGIQMARNIPHVRAQMALLAENPNFQDHLSNHKLKQALYEGMVLVEDGTSKGSSALKKLLQEGTVIGEEAIKTGVGTQQKKILTLRCADGVERKIVFKPMQHEEWQLALSRGSPMGTAWRREIGMSRLAEAVGATDIVPETVAFFHGGSVGSAQRFVEGGITLGKALGYPNPESLMNFGGLNLNFNFKLVPASQAGVPNGTAAAAATEEPVKMVFDTLKGDKLRVLMGMAGETDFHLNNAMVVAETGAEFLPGTTVLTDFDKIDSGWPFPD